MANETDNTVDSSARPIELSFPLPKAPETRIHLRMTIQATSILLFLTTALNRDVSTAPPLGSFVYALPDVRFPVPFIDRRIILTFKQRLNTGQTHSTPLYTYESSVEFTTRLAKLLARKAGRPVYIGNSIIFESAGMGGTVEEEMEGFKRVVDVVMDEIRKSAHDQLVNGTNDR
jgi:hypothetical protein